MSFLLGNIELFNCTISTTHFQTIKKAAYVHVHMWIQLHMCLYVKTHKDTHRHRYYERAQTGKEGDVNGGKAILTLGDMVTDT